MTFYQYADESDIKLDDFTCIADGEKFVLTKGSRSRPFITRIKRNRMTWTAVRNNTFFIQDGDGNLMIGKPDGIECFKFLNNDIHYEDCLNLTNGCRYEIENDILKVYSPNDSRSQFIPTEQLQYWKLKGKIDDFRQSLTVMSLICTDCKWMLSQQKSNEFVVYLQSVIALVESRRCRCETETN